MAKYRIILAVILGTLLVPAIPAQGLAQKATCTAFVVPDKLPRLSGRELFFTVKNTGAYTITEVTITSPSTKHFPVLNRWSENKSAIEHTYESAVFRELSIQPQAEGYFHIYTQTGLDEVESLRWQVEVLTSGIGLQEKQLCSGYTSVMIKGDPVDTNPPYINYEEVEVLSPTSVRITWISDKLATSGIFFGLTNTQIRLKQTKKEYAYNHVMNLTGLQTNTSYAYKLEAVDELGNRTETKAATFSTYVLPTKSLSKPGSSQKKISASIGEQSKRSMREAAPMEQFSLRGMLTYIIDVYTGIFRMIFAPVLWLLTFAWQMIRYYIF